MNPSRDPDAPETEDERAERIETARALPKVELHLHLEGAAPPEFIRELGAEKGLSLAGVFDPDGRYAFRDFGHFLQVYEAATQALRSPDDFGRLVSAVLAQSAEQGVIYTEAFLSPDFCGGGDVSAWREYLHAMQEAAGRARLAHGIEMRGIVTCIRHNGPDQARRSALCAAETASDWLVGFGIAGDETRGRPRDFAYPFDMAREAGLHLTAHAGEWSGARSVEEALRDLRVARIGHGVQAIDDSALVDHLAATGTVLEVCPGSNVALGLYPDLAHHPIDRLRKAGVAVTVSTDDPPFFHTDMRLEYENLARCFGWGADTLTELNRVAARAAFCTPDTRETILKKLEPAAP